MKGRTEENNYLTPEDIVSIIRAYELFIFKLDEIFRKELKNDRTNNLLKDFNR